MWIALKFWEEFEEPWENVIATGYLRGVPRKRVMLLRSVAIQGERVEKGKRTHRVDLMVLRNVCEEEQQHLPVHLLHRNKEDEAVCLTPLWHWKMGQEGVQK